MGDLDPITATEEYKRFRSSIPQRKVTSTTHQHCMGVTFVLLWTVEESYHPFSTDQSLIGSWWETYIHWSPSEIRTPFSGAQKGGTFVALASLSGWCKCPHNLIYINERRSTSLVFNLQSIKYTEAKECHCSSASVYGRPVRWLALKDGCQPDPDHHYSICVSANPTDCSSGEGGRVWCKHKHNWAHYLVTSFSNWMWSLLDLVISFPNWMWSHLDLVTSFPNWMQSSMLFNLA